MICPFCKYKHDNEGGRYGCPNCEGAPMTNTARSNKERQADLNKRQIALGRVRRPVYATPDEHEQIKKLLKGLRL